MTDDVYRERASLVAFLAAAYPSHMGFTDPNEPDWAVVTVATPQGQMCWHVAPADQGLFNHVRRTKPTDAPWDGHSTPEKYERLSRLRGDVWHARQAGDVSRETRTVAQPEHDYAREGFEHYRAFTGGVTYDGRPIPPWEEIAPGTQAAWSAAANRILWLATSNMDDVSRETSPEGDTDG